MNSSSLSASSILLKTQFPQFPVSQKISNNSYQGVLATKTVSVPPPAPVKKKKLSNSISGILPTKSINIPQKQSYVQNQTNSDSSLYSTMQRKNSYSGILPTTRSAASSATSSASVISQDNQDSIQYQNGNDPDELTFAQHLAKAMTQSQLDFEEYENAKKLEDEELQYVLQMSQNEK